MKILVTGGAGFIGSNMVNVLEQQGHDVVIIDNLSTGNIKNLKTNLPSTKFYLQDIRNPEIKKLFEIERPEIVVHFAAQASVIDSVKDPMLDEDINLKGIINLILSSVATGVKKFIFISTGGAIYGDADQVPTSETYLPDAVSPYALTKKTSENYLAVFHKLYSLNYTVLRLANVYGPRQMPKGECGVVPIFFEKCMKNEDAALLTYPDMPDGTYRDYVYVGDVCAAVLKCIDRGDCDIFNIGTGVSLSMRQIFEQIKTVVGSTNQLITKNPRLGDVRKSALDCRKAKQILGWQPQITFSEGLEHTYHHLKENK
ncbi:MAG TPA: GDP-mannose 4,6-dehydratase [Oscillospiraceae bacterium]|nr:GDP-mannose 4,6-dehydratase [Oscillospiraceae bacterium]HPF56855.1 GDP-mannose 4,6-dehydratase [Clostridiales bacterium]HPK36257.1 GDP-mannose 4,6-dehydratase [Oscillospiraceae bacterium]HPR75274.1 GDP-mannose 4,6-dehydratase [Oscillospiraceae bacterium]